MWVGAVLCALLDVIFELRNGSPFLSEMFKVGEIRKLKQFQRVAMIRLTQEIHDGIYEFFPVVWNEHGAPTAEVDDSAKAVFNNFNSLR
jgi:hypothetical protein